MASEETAPVCPVEHGGCGHANKHRRIEGYAITGSCDVPDCTCAERNYLRAQLAAAQAENERLTEEWPVFPDGEPVSQLTFDALRAEHCHSDHCVIESELATLRERLRWRDAAKGELPREGQEVVVQVQGNEAENFDCTTFENDWDYNWPQKGVRWLPLPEVAPWK